MLCVAPETATTAGSPYSRAMIAPWLIRAPTSTTIPTAFKTSGVQPGSEDGAMDFPVLDRLFRRIADDASNPFNTTTRNASPDEHLLGKISMVSLKARDLPSLVITAGTSISMRHSNAAHRAAISISIAAPSSAAKSSSFWRNQTSSPLLNNPSAASVSPTL
jgi:hypothetical protein